MSDFVTDWPIDTRWRHRLPVPFELRRGMTSVGEEAVALWHPLAEMHVVLKAQDATRENIDAALDELRQAVAQRLASLRWLT